MLTCCWNRRSACSSTIADISSIAVSLSTQAEAARNHPAQDFRRPAANCERRRMQQNMSQRLRIFVVIVEAGFTGNSLRTISGISRSKAVPTSFTSAASVIGLSPLSSKPAIEDDILRNAAKWATKRPISMACRSLGAAPDLVDQFDQQADIRHEPVRSGALECQFAGHAGPAFAGLSDHHVVRHKAVPKKTSLNSCPPARFRIGRISTPSTRYRR